MKPAHTFRKMKEIRNLNRVNKTKFLLRFFSKKFRRKERLGFRPTVRIPDFPVMTLVKYRSEIPVLRTAEGDMLNIFNMNCLWIVLSNLLIDSN